jgi:hypothetical protein
MSQAAIKVAEQEAKDALGIERGKGKRVPADRLNEFNDKVQEILKASLLPSDVKTAELQSFPPCHASIYRCRARATSLPRTRGSVRTKARARK